MFPAPAIVQKLLSGGSENSAVAPFFRSNSTIWLLPVSTDSRSSFSCNMPAINLVVSQSAIVPLMTVSPSLFLASTSAPFWINSLAISYWPKKAAACKAVPPSSPLALTSAPFRIRNSAILTWSYRVADNNAEDFKLPPLALISKPFARYFLTELRFPSAAALQIESPFGFKLSKDGIITGSAGLAFHFGIPWAISSVISRSRWRMNCLLCSKARSNW